MCVCKYKYCRKSKWNESLWHTIWVCIANSVRLSSINCYIHTSVTNGMHNIICWVNLSKWDINQFPFQEYQIEILNQSHLNIFSMQNGTLKRGYAFDLMVINYHKRDDIQVFLETLCFFLLKIQMMCTIIRNSFENEPFIIIWNAFFSFILFERKKRKKNGFILLFY